MILGFIYIDDIGVYAQFKALCIQLLYIHYNANLRKVGIFVSLVC